MHYLFTILSQEEMDRELKVCQNSEYLVHHHSETNITTVLDEEDVVLVAIPTKDTWGVYLSSDYYRIAGVTDD